MGGADAGMYGRIHAQNTKRRDAAACVQGTENGQDAGRVRGAMKKAGRWTCFFERLFIPRIRDCSINKAEILVS